MPTELVGIEDKIKGIKMDRNEHLAWAKQRAIEALNQTQMPIQAWASFSSDMMKHEKLTDHIALELGMMQLAAGGLSTVPEMEKFIDGFN